MLGQPCDFTSSRAEHSIFYLRLRLEYASIKSLLREVVYIWADGYVLRTILVTPSIMQMRNVFAWIGSIVTTLRYGSLEKGSSDDLLLFTQMVGALVHSQIFVWWESDLIPDRSQIDLLGKQNASTMADHVEGIIVHLRMGVSSLTCMIPQTSQAITRSWAGAAPSGLVGYAGTNWAPKDLLDPVRHVKIRFVRLFEVLPLAHTFPFKPHTRSPREVPWNQPLGTFLCITPCPF